MKINGVNPTLSVRTPELTSAQSPKTAESPTVVNTQASRRESARAPQPRQPVTAVAVQEAVDEINGVLDYMNDRLEFSVHEATNRVMVKVLDRQTDEVIREIPPEQMLDLLAKLQELVGLLVDKRA